MDVTLSGNPLRVGQRMERAPAPNSLVIFGASGDLTHRKLMPALYDLAYDRRLPVGFSVVGFARRPNTDQEFRDEMRQVVDRYARNRPVEPAVWDSFAQGLFYLPCEFEDPDGYRRLGELFDRLERERRSGDNRLFYLATPPSFYPEIVHQLGAAGLGRSERGWTRIIVEKPFGHDLASAHDLNRQIHEVFAESQVYRIDHYLGKETVQNILVFRFANGIFEPIWNRRYVDHVQITVAESLGIENRGAFYEEAGVVRDIVQNHMLQLLTLVAMEPPVAFDANAVRDEKVKVLRAVRPIKPDQIDEYTVRGQYGPGVMAATPVAGYRQEPKVSPTSTTPTYVALKLFIDNWRWAGVPFYLRTGKRLPKRATEIAMQFKQPPLSLFGHEAANPMVADMLALNIQPDEGISLRFDSKVPGPTLRVRPVNMEFRYGTSFGTSTPDAYERLLLDSMLGDSTLFTRADEVEAQWRFITPVLEGWAAHTPADFPNYEAGTWGPEAADAFIQRDGYHWRRL